MQALLSITKKCSGILLTRFNGCASEDKANNSLVVNETHDTAILTDIYVHTYIYKHEAIQKPKSGNNIGAP